MSITHRTYVWNKDELFTGSSENVCLCKGIKITLKKDKE